MYRLRQKASAILLLLTSILLAVDGLNVKCNFDEYSYWKPDSTDHPGEPKETYYRCILRNISLPESDDTEFYVDKAGYDNRGNLSEMLWIENSDLDTIPSQIFTAFPNLTYLYIFQSNLRELQSASFSKAVNLRKLKIHGVSIPRINEAVFANARYLEYLALIDDSITELDKNAFDGLYLLKELYLKGNQITVPDSMLFAPLKNLEELYLNENIIDSLPGNLFAENTKLKILSLAGNQISEIDPLLFDNVTDLNFIDFAGNECVNEVFNLTVIDVKKLNEKLEKCFTDEESDGEDEEIDTQTSEPVALESKVEEEMEKVIESYNSFMYFLVPTLCLLFVLLVMTFVALYYYISVVKKISIVINDSDPS